MLKTLDETRFRIYTEDVDHMGIVYHANYLLFFERARTEYLRKLDISLPLLMTCGTYFAIYNIYIDYQYPARLDDLISINTECSLMRATTLKFRQKMNNEAGKGLSCATVEAVCLNEQLKPKRISRNLLEKLNIVLQK